MRHEPSITGRGARYCRTVAQAVALLLKTSPLRVEPGFLRTIITLSTDAGLIRATRRLFARTVAFAMNPPDGVDPIEIFFCPARQNL